MLIVTLFSRIKESLHSHTAAGIKDHNLGGLTNGTLSQSQLTNPKSRRHRAESSTGLWASMSLSLCPCCLWLLSSLWDSLICGSTVPIVLPLPIYKEYEVLPSLLWPKQIRKRGVTCSLKENRVYYGGEGRSAGAGGGWTQRMQSQEAESRLDVG